MKAGGLPRVWFVFLGEERFFVVMRKSASRRFI